MGDRAARGGKGMVAMPGTALRPDQQDRAGGVVDDELGGLAQRRYIVEPSRLPDRALLPANSVRSLSAQGSS